MTVEERVARGAALLDQKRPGWENEIDLTKLNLVSYNDCMLGQLYIDFIDGERQLFPEGPRFGIEYWAPPKGERQRWPAFTHGFMPPEDEDGTGAGNEFGNAEGRALTEEWKRVITERRMVVR